MSKKILVVESDVPFAGIIAGALQAGGVAVALARDAAAALDAARAERPDAIVLCAELTGGSGFVVCNKLRKDPQLREIPLLMTSAEATEETFEQHRRLKTRADAYLRKPVAIAELLRELSGIAGLQLPSPAASQPAPASASPSPSSSRSASLAPALTDEDELAAFDAAFDSIAQLEGTPGPIEQPISAEDAEAAAGALDDDSALLEPVGRIEAGAPAAGFDAVAIAATDPQPTVAAHAAVASPPVTSNASTQPGEAESLRAEVASLGAELERARAQLEPLRAEVASLRAERDAAHAQAREAEARVSEAAARAQGAEAKLQAEATRQERAREAVAAALSLLERSGD